MEAGFLTVIVILFILVTALLGVIQGFYGAVKLTCFLIVLTILTIAFSPKASDFLGKLRFINSYLDEEAADFVSEKTQKIAEGADRGFLQNISIPDELEAALQNGDVSIIQSESNQLSLKNAVKALFIYALAVFFTMGVSFVALLILMFIFSKIIKSPKVQVIDRVMGFVLGILEGLIAVWMILALLHLVEFYEPAGDILRFVHASSLLSILDDSNLIYLSARYAMGL